MRAYYVKFDVDNKKMGLAKAKTSSAKSILANKASRKSLVAEM